MYITTFPVQEIKNTKERLFLIMQAINTYVHSIPKYV